MAKLVILTGKNRGKRMTLPERDVLIGRDKTCAISLATDEVSREHCLLRFVPGTLFARDLKSRNGTFVNDHAIQEEVELQHGDILRVGPMIFRVETRAFVPGVVAESSPADTSPVVADRPTPAPFPFADRPTPMPGDHPTPAPADRPVRKPSASGEGPSEDSVANWLIEDEPQGGTGDSTVMAGAATTGASSDASKGVAPAAVASKKVFGSIAEEAADIFERHRGSKSR